MDESRSEGTQAGDGSGGDVPAVDVGRMREVRLLGFLRELERQLGPMATARLLDVDYKTLKRSLDGGRVTRHVAEALDGLTGDGDDDGKAGRLPQSTGQLTGELPEGPPGPARPGDARPVADVVSPDRDDRPTVPLGDGNDRRNGESPATPREEPGDASTPTAPPVEHRPVAPPVMANPAVAGLTGDRTARPRRANPELVAPEAAPDDPEVYGDAWPLVAEWRRLWDDHPRQGRSLSWLTTRERILELELALLEEHGLTLPPETEPLRGFARRGQTRWREAALARVRRARRRARRRRWLLHWLLRKLTLGRWPR